MSDQADENRIKNWVGSQFTSLYCPRVHATLRSDVMPCAFRPQTGLSETDRHAMRRLYAPGSGHRRRSPGRTLPGSRLRRQRSLKASPNTWRPPWCRSSGCRWWNEARCGLQPSDSAEQLRRWRIVGMASSCVLCKLCSTRSGSTDSTGPCMRAQIRKNLKTAFEVRKLGREVLWKEEKHIY